MPLELRQAMEHNQIRFVTANYHQLQGLRLVPLGLLLVLLGMLNSGLVPPAFGAVRARYLTWIGIASMLLVALTVLAPVLYRRRYGSVDPVARGWRNAWITAAVVGVLVLGRLDTLVQWPVRTSLFLVSASLFITVWHDGRMRAHYLVPAVAWLVVSFLPTLNMSPAATRLTVFGLGGLTLIVCGIGDHLLVTRTLATPRTTDDASHPATL
jgi:hypothetical protein